MDRASPAHGTSSLPMSPSWARVDVTFMVVLFVVGLVLALVLAPWWLEPSDDGLYMHQANVILQGGVPYRDYLLHDPPLGNAWHALMLALFGNDLLVLRLAVVPFKALILPAVYALSRPLVPRGPAVVAALVAPVMDTGSNYNVAHIALNALGLAFVVVVLLMVWERRPRPGWLVTAGIVLGLMTGFKQNMGFFVLAGAALWLAEALPGSPKSVGAVREPPLRLSGRFANRPYELWTLIGTWGAATLAAVWMVRAHPEPNVLLSLVLPIGVLGVAAVVRSLNWRRGFSGARLAGVGEGNGEGSGGESGEGPPVRDDSGTTAPGLREVLLRWTALGAGFAAATLPWLVWAGLGVGLPALINNLLIVPGELPKYWFVALRQPVPAFWWVLGLYVGGAVVAGACLALTRVLGGARFGAFAAWAGLAVWGAVLVFVTPLREYSTTGVIYIWIYFNIVVFWPAFLLIELLPDGPRRTHARLLLITATFLALEMYPHLRRVHSNWCFPLFLPLAAWLLWEGVVAIRRLAAPAARRSTGAVPALAVALLPALAFWWILDWRVSQFVDVPATLRTGRFTPAPATWLELPHFHTLEVPDKAAFARKVAHAITSRTRPGEPIYCLYREIAYYLATERPPAVLNVYAPPESTAADAEAMTRELERAKVRIILVDNAILSPDGPRDPFFSINVVPWAVPLRNYLVYNFHKVEDLDPWSVWERK